MSWVVPLKVTLGEEATEAAQWLAAVQSTGPFQEPFHQASMRWLPAPCQKISWVVPSGASATLGAEVTDAGQWLAAVQSTGPFQCPFHQTSKRCPPGPWQKISWVPLAWMTTLGAEVTVAAQPLAAVQSTGPFQEPFHQASMRCPPAPDQKRSWVPSLPTVTAGWPTPVGGNGGGGRRTVQTLPALLQSFWTVYTTPSPPVIVASRPLQMSPTSPLGLLVGLGSYQAMGAAIGAGAASPTFGSVITSASSWEDTAVTR